MAIVGNNYPNIPGMLIDFKDGGQALRFDETDITTDSMLILGTAVDGPVMEPVAIDPKTVELTFGSELKANGAPNGATLVHAAKQAFAAGCKDVRLMRISGSESSLIIKAADKVESLNERIDENLTIVQGNDETKITLTAKKVELGTIRVYVKGVEIKDGVSASNEDEDTVITISKNACEAGATVLVKFKYLKDVDVEKEYVVNSSNKVILDKGVIVDSVTVQKDGEDVGKEKYSVDGNVITFTQTDLLTRKKRAVEGDITVGNVVTVKYKKNVTMDGNENSNDDGPYLTATSEQIVTIKEEPTGSLILYMDDAKVLDTSAYTLEGKSLKIKKERFLKDQKISVSYYVNKKVTVKNEIKLQSKFAGAVYNTGTVEVKPILDEQGTKIGAAVTITKPDSKLSTAELPETYTSFNFPTFGELVDAINSNNTVYKAKTDTPNISTADLLESNSYFEEGDDGLNLTKDEMFTALSGERDEEGNILKLGAYQLLENYQTDYLVPVGVYADDKLQDRHQNFAYELALVCAAISQKNKTTYGAISMSPLKDSSLAGVQEHAEYLKEYDNTYYMRDLSGAFIKTADEEFIDLGKFISVVVGPTPIFNHRVSALREGDPAVMYCAFNTVLKAQSAPTNKLLIGTNGVKFVYSNAQLNDIVGNRFVVFGTKFSRNGQALKGAYIIDGPTAAAPGSQYARLTTCKVIRVVADLTREIADPYIGEPNTIEQKNALSAALSKGYDTCIEQGVILDYSFNLVSSPQDVVLGQAKLELGLQTPQELRKITTVVGLK